MALFEKTRYIWLPTYLKDKDSPLLAKIFAGITVGYALSPVDLIPDFIPVLGYLDDVILLPMLVVLTIKFIPDNVMERNRKKSEGIWKDGKPEKWYYSIPIVAIWIMILALLLKIFLWPDDRRLPEFDIPYIDLRMSHFIRRFSFL